MTEQLKLPKMILFDYGETLLYETDVDFIRGEKALFPYITKNRNNVSAEEISAFSLRIFNKMGDARKIDMELNQRQQQQIVYESLGIEFSISYQEAEQILWDNAAKGAVIPGAEKMLDYVNRAGIRSGVISNIGWSGNALKNRINCLLPKNQFEFIIASSDYGFRKPSPYLFKLAVEKSGLKPEELWFCGDNPIADVEGAAGVGIFPVWYSSNIESGGRIRPKCSCLHIEEWAQLTAQLEKLSP